jgi:hypothetical protein
LIIGDSPPPPSGSDDVFWRELVEPANGVRTNVLRLSPDFRSVLQSLAKDGVPIGWLYVQPEPGLGGGASEYAHAYRKYAGVRQRTEAALRKVVELEIERVGSLKKMDAGLEELLERMESLRLVMS